MHTIPAGMSDDDVLVASPEANSAATDTVDTAAPAEVALQAPFSKFENRQHQLYPHLTPAEVSRLHRFGSRACWKKDDYLYRIGDISPGMFVILSGRFRVLVRDGIGRETVLIEHGSGHFICEVGQLSNKPAIASVLVLEDVEALVITPESVRTLLTAEAELGERIMRALILRRAALIEKGVGPILLGCSVKSGLLPLQGFLQRNGYPHTVLDNRSDPDAVALLERLAPTEDDFPLVLCPDGSILRAPDVGQLATHLGLIPEFDPATIYDVAIVGAGPAGLATAVYAASEGLSVALFDFHAPGGQAGASARIENYLGFPTGISGNALAARAFIQAQKFGARVAIPTRIKALHCGNKPMQLELFNGSRVSTRTVVIASGAVYRRPAIPELERYEDRGVYYWASPIEAKLCKGEEIVVVGGGNSAGQAIAFLASSASHVHVLIRAGGLEASMSKYLIDRISSLPNVTLHTRSEIVAFEGDEVSLKGVHCRCGGNEELIKSLPVRHVFLFVGADPNTGWLHTCPVQLNDKGFVLTGADVEGPVSNKKPTLESSAPGVFAIGDVRWNSTKRVAAAVGEGAAAVAQIHAFIAAM
ncbi:FAD-dependent oxidoreductase [Undibacterium sp. TJN25]|uniref:FAD-dependent oxidoreductase n=1 Tax=Undibacterium sp. TJN25 TaxID=3413056 RepID=UPI003BF29247